jgi:hypothetical protein
MCENEVIHYRYIRYWFSIHTISIHTMGIGTYEALAAVGFFLAIFFGIVLLVRLFGAWMLRINEIIHLQEGILDELRKMNARL